MSSPPDVTLFVSGMASGWAAPSDPDGDLLVTEAVTGRVLRVDPKNGDVSTFASGLPIRIVGTGGAMDYRIHRRNGVRPRRHARRPRRWWRRRSGRLSGRRSGQLHCHLRTSGSSRWPIRRAHRSLCRTSGVQYAIENYHGGFLVTDGHHNRVLHVGHRDGEVTESIALGNIVPTAWPSSGN